MSETKHTPGPWLVATDPHYGVEIHSNAPTRVVEEYRKESDQPTAWGGRTLIAAVKSSINGSGREFGPRDLMGEDEFNANAALLASAPDLLAACQLALEVERERDRPDGLIIEKLEAAIAKAVPA